MTSSSKMLAETRSFLDAKVFLSIPCCGAAFGFETVKLESFVSLGGGQVAHTPEDATHIVAWHMQQPDALHLSALSSAPDGPKLCSLVWFFACMDANELLPNAHPLYTPFPGVSIPTDPGPALRVCVTGFMSRWRMMVQIFTTCLGVAFTKELHISPVDKDDVLVVADLNEPSRKLTAAQSVGMPAVTLQWIIDSLQQWKILPTEPYTTPADVTIVFKDEAPPHAAHAAADVEVISDSEAEPSMDHRRVAPDADADVLHKNPLTVMSVNKKCPQMSTGATAATAGHSGGSGTHSQSQRKAMGVVGKLAAALAAETQQPSGQEQRPEPLQLLPSNAPVEITLADAAMQETQAIQEEEEHDPKEKVEENRKHIKSPAAQGNVDDADGGNNANAAAADDATPTPSQLSLQRQTGPLLGDDDDEQEEADAEGSAGARMLPETEAFPLMEHEEEEDGEEEVAAEGGALEAAADDGNEGIGEDNVEMEVEDQFPEEGRGESPDVEKSAGAGAVEVAEVEMKDVPRGRAMRSTAVAHVDALPVPVAESKPKQRPRKQKEPTRAPFSPPQKAKDGEEEKTDASAGAAGRRAQRRQQPAKVEPPVVQPKATSEPKKRKQQEQKTLEKEAAVKGKGASGSKAPPAKKSKTALVVAAPKKEAKAKAAAKAPSKVPGVHLALSGMHRDEQQALLSLAETLNVQCTGGTHSWQPGFTHIVAPEVKRNQKCLSALAAGVWVVGPSFLRSSISSGKLVKEEEHELSAGTGSLVENGVAAHWRKQAQKTGHGAFSGLTFALTRTIDAPPTRDDISAIIKAGGGEIVPLSRPADVVVTSAADSAGGSALAQRIKGGALCVTSLYIVDWLAKPHASLDEHVLFDSSRGAAVAAAEKKRRATAGLKGANQRGNGRKKSQMAQEESLTSISL